MVNLGESDISQEEEIDFNHVGFISHFVLFSGYELLNTFLCGPFPSAIFIEPFLITSCFSCKLQFSLY